MDRQEGKILETHIITTKVHEMKVKGYHLVEKKQLTNVYPKASDWSYMPSMHLLIHSRSVSIDDPSNDDHCYLVQENITDGDCQTSEVIRTEGKKYLDQFETEMTPEEVKKFEEGWSKLWKPTENL